MHCELEKQSLTNKLEKLRNQLSSVTQRDSSEDIQRYIAESPAPKRTKTSTESVIIPSTPESNATVGLTNIFIIFQLGILIYLSAVSNVQTKLCISRLFQ